MCAPRPPPIRPRPTGYSPPDRRNEGLDAIVWRLPRSASRTDPCSSLQAVLHIRRRRLSADLRCERCASFVPPLAFAPCFTNSARLRSSSSPWASCVSSRPCAAAPLGTGLARPGPPAAQGRVPPRSSAGPSCCGLSSTRRSTAPEARAGAASTRSRRDARRGSTATGRVPSRGLRYGVELAPAGPLPPLAGPYRRSVGRQAARWAVRPFVRAPSLPRASAGRCASRHRGRWRRCVRGPR